MFVRVANWFRCRRLAYASPALAGLIQGAKVSPIPKYCINPMTLLNKLATSHAPATDRSISSALVTKNPAPTQRLKTVKETARERSSSAVAVRLTNNASIDSPPTQAGENIGVGVNTETHAIQKRFTSAGITTGEGPLAHGLNQGNAKQPVIATVSAIFRGDNNVTALIIPVRTHTLPTPRVAAHLI